MNGSAALIMHEKNLQKARVGHQNKTLASTSWYLVFWHLQKLIPLLRRTTAVNEMIFFLRFPASNSRRPVKNENEAKTWNQSLPLPFCLQIKLRQTMPSSEQFFRSEQMGGGIAV